MALIENEKDARRLARAIASDLSLYNEEKIAEGVEHDKRVADYLALVGVVVRGGGVCGCDVCGRVRCVGCGWVLWVAQKKQ